MNIEATASKKIPTLVKNSMLVTRKRRELVDAAVGLFIRKGFHQTTTREIAQAAGFSIGTLYEYIESKEDVLYLVCEAIHGEMEAALRSAMQEGATARETLVNVFGNYVQICDEMQDSILLIYRESSSLKPASRRFVLQNEARIASIFEAILKDGIRTGAFKKKDRQAITLATQNIMVLGHMWAFRRWALRSKFSVKSYIKQQTALLLSEFCG